MLPPGDSWQHQNLKLREALDGVKRIEVPPPAYMATETNEGFVNQGIGDYIEDQYDEEISIPIALTIDASIVVEGQGNNIILPEANTMTSSEDNFTSPNDAVQGNNANRITLLTEAVFKALQKSQLIKASETRSHSLNLHINASIKVKGDKNVIFAGPKAMKKSIAVPTVGSDQTNRSGEVEPNMAQAGDQERSNKRRATSETLDEPSNKKINL